MQIPTKDAERLMKRCQIGVGGRNALGDATLWARAKEISDQGRLSATGKSGLLRPD